MELNITPGKSAVVLRFQGPGKKKAVSDLFKSNNLIRINKLPDDFSEVLIGVVDSYKHLGTQISLRVCCTKLLLGVASCVRRLASCEPFSEFRSLICIRKFI